MNEIQKLQNQLLYNRGLGMGLCVVMTSLFAAHVKEIGGDTESAIQKTRRVLDESLASIKATGGTPDGEKIDLSTNVHSGITRLLNQVEVSARSALGLARGTSKRQ